MGKKIVSIHSVAIFLWILIVFHFIAFFGDLYQSYNGLDKISHFLGGFWLTILFSHLVQRFKWPEGSFITVLGWVALFTIFWEFHEFLADKLINNGNLKMQVSVSDTMGDLFFGLLGATIFLAWKKLLLLMEAKS